MIEIKVEKWAAIAPGLESRADWKQWLRCPEALPDSLGKLSLDKVPPLLRRRLGTLGKCAMKTALQIVNEKESIPSVFSSRHGDTSLTHSLLQEMGRDEPMSPTYFSLAVHNAVSGLFSIARRDTSMVTSLAAVEGLVLHTLLEAAGHLQLHEKVLCVIYDIPLPELYTRYCAGNGFPYAIAMILSQTGGSAFCIEQCEHYIQDPTSALPGSQPIELESFRFLELLTDISNEMSVEVNGAAWRIVRTAS